MSENAMTWRLIKLVGKYPSKAELAEIKDILWFFLKLIVLWNRYSMLHFVHYILYEVMHV